MVQPLQPGCWVSAARAGPRLVVDLGFSGLHSANENESRSPPLFHVSNISANVKRQPKYWNSKNNSDFLPFWL